MSTYKAVSERLELLYPVPLVVELVGKAAKEASKRGFGELPASARRGLELILSGVFVIPVVPSAKSLALAAKLWVEGHRDLFDNIAYACSTELKAYPLTLDTKLINFLEKRGYPTSNIVNLDALKTVVRQSLT